MRSGEQATRCKRFVFAIPSSNLYGGMSLEVETEAISKFSDTNISCRINTLQYHEHDKITEPIPRQTPFCFGCWLSYSGGVPHGSWDRGESSPGRRWSALAAQQASRSEVMRLYPSAVTISPHSQGACAVFFCVDIVVRISNR